MKRRELLRLFAAWSGVLGVPSWARGSPTVPPQAYFAAVNRALEVLANLGSPISAQDRRELERLSDTGTIDDAERILSRYTLLEVQVEPDGFARTTPGHARPELLEQGWRLFLIRVSNPVGSTNPLEVVSLQASSGKISGTGNSGYGVDDGTSAAPSVSNEWLNAILYNSPTAPRDLSGLYIEYKVIQLYSRDRGERSARLHFVSETDAARPAHISKQSYAALTAVWQYRERGATLNFVCKPSRDIAFRIEDSDGDSSVASLTIRDSFGRIYPSQTMRIAPDMWFQQQIYRGDGETVRLADGQYTVESKRGPEYRVGTQEFSVNESTKEIAIKLRRWIDPKQWGWYSGDTHIHASGCAHYSIPTEGVAPETIIRHARGEGLWVSQVLTWAPGWYYQKRFFTGRADSPRATLESPALQKANNANLLRTTETNKDSESIIRYDVEVSGFPSSHSGHPVLLRLTKQDYPGTKVLNDWPSWNLPILRWAKEQGAVTGYAHCGAGMEVESDDLPNYIVPFFEGPGANEAIVDVTHGVLDFLSGCNGSPVADLNTWYHILNCGFRLAMVGETDFPCVTDERPGAGRSYVRLDRPPIGNEGYEAWIRALQAGQLYFGDGRSHFLSFSVNGHRSGDDDVFAKEGDTLHVHALVSALLSEDDSSINENAPCEKSFLNGWNLCRARIGKTRNVRVELVVNGKTVDQRTIEANGVPHPLRFKIPVLHSSWIGMRLLPSSHTHPVFVIISGHQVKCSKRSAQWCRACVDALWPVVSPFIRETERPAAAEAYDHARRVYESLVAESVLP